MRRFVSAANSRAVASRSALFRATIATSAPSRANSRAMALPMPRLPPVTIACLPCNPRSMALSPLGGVTAILSLRCSLFSLREPGARVARRRTMYGTCPHASGRAAAARARYMGAPHPKAAVAESPRTEPADSTHSGHFALRTESARCVSPIATYDGTRPVRLAGLFVPIVSHRQTHPFHQDRRKTGVGLSGCLSPVLRLYRWGRKGAGQPSAGALATYLSMTVGQRHGDG